MTPRAAIPQRDSVLGGIEMRPAQCFGAEALENEAAADPSECPSSCMHPSFEVGDHVGESNSRARTWCQAHHFLTHTLPPPMFQLRGRRGLDCVEATTTRTECAAFGTKPAGSLSFPIRPLALFYRFVKRSTSGLVRVRECSIAWHVFTCLKSVISRL